MCAEFFMLGDSKLDLSAFLIIQVLLFYADLFRCKRNNKQEDKINVTDFTSTIFPILLFVSVFIVFSIIILIRDIKRIRKSL
jgi:hypothetical protein